MTHLPHIAGEPHPAGSPAQAVVRDYLLQELTEIGLEVDIQRKQSVENVVARLHGSDPSGAIVILAHYDSDPAGPGAADNGSGVAALLEIMRALSAGPTPQNDVIALFDDAEELGRFAGTKAFIREHAWMPDVRVAISLDTAVRGPTVTNETGPRNGWLVQALARSYTGGDWTTLSGGGGYDYSWFRKAGIQGLALEDNYPFKEKHTAFDVPEIVSAASVQQMGEQTLAIARQLGGLELNNPWGEQETYFSLAVLGFIHYPQAWAVPLAIITGILLVIALGLTLWRRFTSWRGLLVAFLTILVTIVLAAIGIYALWPVVPGLMGWETHLWPEWPEVIPPNGALIASLFGLLVLALAVFAYILARRWSARADWSLVGLVIFLIPALALAFALPRAAYILGWPVMISSLGWIVAATAGKRHVAWSVDAATFLAALSFVVFLLPLLPAVVMSDGMKSLAILGQIKLKDLRPDHIQGFYNRLLDEDVGVYTILKIHTLLHIALHQAVRTGMIVRNPSGLVSPPREPAREMVILNESQVSQLLIAAKGHRWEALYHLAVVTGMRQMELLGLKWSDLDWIRQTLKVERQLAKPDGNGVKFSAPKTRYGRRSLALGRKTIEILRKHYELQLAERLSAGEAWQEYNLIFTTGNGTPIHPRNLLRDYKKLLQDAGLPPIRFHDLRHTSASLLLNQGTPVITVSRRLGHARASITLDVYGHLIPSMQSEVAELIDDLVMPVAVQLNKEVASSS